MKKRLQEVTEKILGEISPALKLLLQSQFLAYLNRATDEDILRILDNAVEVIEYVKTGQNSNSPE